MTENELYKIIIDNINLPSTRTTDTSVVNVSAIYNTCPRGFILSKKNNVLLHAMREKMTDCIKMTYKIGLKVEEIICESLNKYKVENPSMKLNVGKFVIVGHIDKMIAYGGNRYIIEIKSINRDDFKKLNKYPLYKHEHQLLTYLYLAKKNKLGVKCGFIVYVSKEAVEPPIKIYKVKLTKGFISEMDNFIKDLNKSKIPKRICPTKEHAKITNCPIINICFE